MPGRPPMAPAVIRSEAELRSLEASAGGPRADLPANGYFTDKS